MQHCVEWFNMDFFKNEPGKNFSASKTHVNE